MGRTRAARGKGRLRRLEREPPHLRQIVVAGVFRMADQTGRDGPAVLEFNSLQGRRQVQADHRREIADCQAGELRKRRGGWRPVFATSSAG